MVEELKLAIKIDDASIEQSLLKQFANAQKMADKVVLDFKNVNFDDKQIEAKFKEMQKKAGQNPIDFSISGNTLDMLGQIDKRLTEIFSIGKGKSFIDSSSTVADIGKIENKINELNKKYEEAQKKLSSIGSGGISGKDVNLVDNKEFQKLSDNFEKIKGEIDELKQKINTIDIDTEWLNNFTTGLDEELTDTQAKLDNFINDFNSSFEKINTSTSNTFFNEESIKIFEKLLTSIESSLSSIKGILVDVGDGEELSPLLREINNIQTAIGGLSSSLNNLHFNMNIDMGTDNQMDAKIQEKAAKALNAYEKLFNGLKMSGYGGEVVNNKFFDFDINKFDTTIGKVKAYKDIIERLRKEAKEYYGGTDLLRTQTDDKLWRSASSAGGQLTQAINETVKNKTDNPLTELFGKTDLSGVIEQLNTIVSKLDEISVSAKGFTETFKNGLNVNASVEEIEKLTNRVKELEAELAKIKTPTAVTSEPTKDAFLNADTTASVEKIADGFKEVKHNTEQATEVTEKYQRVLSQVGELGVDAKVSAMYQRNDGQLESVSWKAKRDDQGQILYDKNGNIDYDFNSTVISKYEQLEKIITTADNKLRDLQKSLKDTQNLNSNASTKNIEEQIQYQKDYIQLLEQTVKAISQQDEYLLYEQQIIDARAKAEKEYNLNQGTKSDISNAKQLASDEQKRQKSIEQTNRLLNKQQIIIDGIEKSYSKAVNNDLDKAVNSQSDLAELEKKKNLIQFLLNGLKNEDRNSSNEKEFLQVEKLIAEYKQLAKDKLKANNPSKQELGGQELDVLLANQVTQYNKLISQSEKYGDATKEITNELKAQRDLIAEQDKNGVYVARSKKADGSEITANDYYDARDNYKISKSIFSSYETDIKSASNMVKQEASNIQAEWDKNIKAIQDYMDSMTKLNNLKAKDKGTGSEANQIALQTQNVEKLKQAAWDARQNLSSMQAENSDIITWKQWVDMMKLFDQSSKGSAESAAKLKDVLNNIKAPSLDKYENKLSSYLNKTGGYNATIARFNDGGWTSDIYLKNVQAVKDAVKQYEDLLSDIKAKGGIASEDDIQKLKEYESEIKNTIATVTNMSAAEKGYNFVSGQKELDKIHKLLNENSKMSSEAKAKIRAYYAEIESGNPSMSLDKIHGEILKIYNAEVEAGRAGRTLWDTLKNSGFHQIAAQMAGMVGVYDVINLGKEGFNVVRELNTALTEMRKVSDESLQSLKNYQNTTFDTADAVGTTAKQIQNSTADWMRLGESMNQAAESAKDANVLFNVSEFEGIDEATESLVSMSQAYKDLDKMDIINVLNNIGNNYSISTDGLATALKDSASALVTANNDLNEAVSLTTAGNAITQDPSKVGAGLRTISLRLVGTEEAKKELSDLGEETDGMITTVSKLRDIIMDATKAASSDGKGFDIFDSNGNYKSTYEIMQGLADLYDNIVKKDKELGTNNLNLLLETIAGKNRANIAASILQNGDMLRSVYEDAQNSEGSAEKELNSYLDSIDGKMAQLENRAQEFWFKVIDSETIKNGIDLLSTLLKGATDFVDTVGLLPTIFTGIGAALSFKNVG